MNLSERHLATASRKRERLMRPKYTMVGLNGSPCASDIHDRHERGTTLSVGDKAETRTTLCTNYQPLINRSRQTCVSSIWFAAQPFIAVDSRAEPADHGPIFRCSDLLPRLEAIQCGSESGGGSQHVATRPCLIRQHA